MKIPKLCLLACLLGLTVILRGVQSERTHAQDDIVRSHEWVQTAGADFARGEMIGLSLTDLADGELCLASGATTGVYTSTAVTSPFAFNAVAPHWRATVPDGSSLRVEMRIYTASSAWSPWYPFDEVDWVVAKGQFYPESPLLSSAGGRFQYRLILTATPGGQSPVLDAMTVTVIDTTAGPTTSQAKAVTLSGPTTTQAVPQPTIISRAGWGADESLRYDDDSYLIWPQEYRDVDKIVIHHTVSANNYTEDQAASRVRAIYYYHAVTRGWGDIGYNYLVDRYGNVYEGRYGGPGVVGGHVRGYNYGSMGAGTIGTYGNAANSVPPTAETLTALADLAAWEAGRSYIHPLESAPFYDTITANLAGHRDYPPGTTACPGDYLYDELPGLRQDTWDRIVSQGDEYHVDWLAWSTPTHTLLAGQTYSLTISVRNTGWLTWPKAGIVNSVRLGYHWLDAGGQPAVQLPEDDHRAPLDHDVTFGHTYGFEPALVTTPITPGVYTLAWDMVHEGATWFHDANLDSPLLTMSLVITGTPPLTISGKLLDVRGRPVSGGRVTLRGWTTATADENGHYVMPRLARAAYTLTASAEGYASQLPAYRVDATGGDVTYPFVLVPNGLTDLVSNGDFENGLTGWARGTHPFAIYLPLALKAYSPGDDPTSSQRIASAAAHTGLGGALLAGGGSSYSPWLSQTVDLPASALSPTLSLLYRSPLPGDDAVLRVALVSETSTFSHDLPLTAAEWTHFWTGLPEGWSGPVKLQLQLVQSNTLTSAAVFVDEVRLGHWVCTELIANGGFEETAAWEILDTAYPAAYSTAQAHSGSRSLRTGIEPGGSITPSYSSAQQAAVLPANLSSATLTYWRYPVSDDADDFQYVLLLDGQGNVMDTLLWASGDDQIWLNAQADLSAHAGQTVTLRFGVYNDGDSDLTRMYVDDVSLQVCTTP